MNMQAMLEQVQVIVGHRCSLVDLFSQAFVESYTKLPSSDAFTKKLPFDPSDLGIVSDEKLTKFVKNYTSFDSWKQLVTQATIFYKMR